MVFYYLIKMLDKAQLGSSESKNIIGAQKAGIPNLGRASVGIIANMFW